MSDSKPAHPDPNLFKIDTHTHILPETWPDLRERYGYGGFVRLEHHKPCCAKMMIDNKFFREIEWNCWDPHPRMQECDRHGVNVQVLSTVPVMFNYRAKPEHTADLSRLLNDHIAGIVADYPHRFLGLGTLPMQDTDLAVRELERCMRSGLSGIEIATNINDMNLNDPQLFPIFEAAQDLGAAIFVHPWNIMGKADMPEYWLPWLVGMPAETSRAICSMIFGGIFERLPNLRVLFAHAGGSFPATIGRVEHGYNVRPDLCAIDNPVNPKEYLGQFYIDSLTHDPDVLDYVVKLMGENKVCLGTDYPFPLGELEPGKLIESMPYNTALKQKLAALNAADWLGLNHNRRRLIGLPTEAPASVIKQ